MPIKEIPGSYSSRTLTLKWGGDGTTDAEELLVDYHGGGSMYVEGPALRDALLEAFPLEVAKPAKPEREFVPGMVFKAVDYPYHYVILPDGKYVQVGQSRAYTYADFGTDPSYTLVFDPRDAKALPSPLGIRVGDTVRRVEKVDDETRIVEFEVGYISSYGDISSKYGKSYSVKGFEVLSREVPDRLPAGTIVRAKGWDVLCLRLEQGFINLRYNDTYPEADFSIEGESMENGVNAGLLEVIYLP